MRYLVPIETMMGPSGGKGDYWISKSSKLTDYGTFGSSSHALFRNCYKKLKFPKLILSHFGITPFAH